MFHIKNTMWVHCCATTTYFSKDSKRLGVMDQPPKLPHRLERDAINLNVWTQPACLGCNSCCVFVHCRKKCWPLKIHSHDVCIGCVDPHRVAQAGSTIPWKGHFADVLMWYLLMKQRLWSLLRWLQLQHHRWLVRGRQCVIRAYWWRRVTVRDWQ